MSEVEQRRPCVPFTTEPDDGGGTEGTLGEFLAAPRAALQQWATAAAPYARNASDDSWRARTSRVVRLPPPSPCLALLWTPHRRRGVARTRPPFEGLAEDPAP